MDPESSAEFTTDCTNAEPKSPLCEVLPVPTEVERLLGGLGRHCPSNRSKFQVQAQNKTGCWGQLHGWGPWELHLCKVKHDSALCRVQNAIPAHPAGQAGEDESGGREPGPQKRFTLPPNQHFPECVPQNISLSCKMLHKGKQMLETFGKAAAGFPTKSVTMPMSILKVLGSSAARNLPNLSLMYPSWWTGPQWPFLPLQTL